MGNHIHTLNDMVGDGRRVGIIENALDNIPEPDRVSYRENIYDIYQVFEKLGFEPANLDLREYFDDNEALEQKLREYDLIWACGGNAFLLLRAMKQSGFDRAIKKLLDDDQVVYGGWSAGACVMSPSLKGIDLCDKPHDVAAGYNKEVVWEGLGLVNFTIAPHYRSHHPESEMIEDVVKYCEEHSIPYRGIRDGDVVIVNNGRIEILKFEDGQESLLNFNRSQWPKDKNVSHFLL